MNKWELFFFEFRDALLKYCNHLCSNPEDANDLYQDTVLKLWRFQKPDIPPSFEFAKKVASQLSYNKKMQKQISFENRAQLYGELDEESLTWLSLEEDLASGVDQDETISRILKESELISAESRCILEIFLEHDSVDDIAVSLGLIKATAKSKYRRLIFSLSKRLSPQFVSGL